jgi:hypothetical protein
VTSVRIVDVTDEAGFERIPPCADPGFDHRTCDFWEDDRRAPDFARTVEIHRKPGYDPVELFLDPTIRIPPLTVGWKLAKRKAGFRSLLDVIPLDATLVKGSHGRQTGWDEEGPVFITRTKELVSTHEITSVDVHQLILRHLGCS